MRYLTFDVSDPTSVDNFNILYGGLCGTMKPLERAEVRVVSRVQDKMEALGSPVQEGNRANFALSKSGTIELEDAEYKMMADCLTECRWSSKMARQTDRALDWFEKVPDSQDQAVPK